jgi:hypothetical protein
MRVYEVEVTNPEAIANGAPGVCRIKDHLQMIVP